jgi:vacuolar protein sorting-associated protein 35
MTSEPPAAKYGVLPPEPEQVAFVAAASERIQSYAFLMNRQFDEGQPEKALEYATTMLDDMKTNLLNPIHYNELYQLILSNLSRLCLCFQDPAFFSERRVAELYEVLQYTSCIVPRLYLLFTIAPPFVKCGHASANDVMRDLIELARGVQHPTRALFLRHFLLHIMKDVLPDGRDPSAGTLENTLTFILENFKQMNVLWVRLEFSLDTKTSDERKIQRSQLKQLVGSNIQRIAGLRGLDVTHYKEIIMPCIVEQVQACRESLAQTYIIESITQVFPCEFHIETLSELFGLFTRVEDDVQTLTLVNAIIGRLQLHFGAEDADRQLAIQTVHLVAVEIDKLLKAGQTFALEDTLEMLATLLGFTLESDVDNTSNVNNILLFVENHIDGIYGDARLDSVPVSRKLRFFLLNPLRKMKDAAMVFRLEYFPVLVNRMMYGDRRLIALQVCEGFARTEAYIDNSGKLRQFFGIAQVLLQKPSDYQEDPDGEPISVGLHAVARVFPLIQSRESVDDTFELLSSVIQTVQNLEAAIQEHLYLSLGQALLHIAVSIAASPDGSNTTVRQCLQLFYSMLSNGEPPPIPSLWLFLEGTKVSDLFGTEPITTEFFVSAMRLWKDTMIDSSLKYRILLVMIRTATQLRRLSAGRYSSLTAELCASASTLLQKDQQAEAHLLCSHMFNVARPQQEAAGEEEDAEEAFHNPDKIKNCLVRALKAASSMMEPMDQLPWFYRVLGHAIYYLENRVDLPPEWFNALTAKIDQEHEDHAKEIEQRMPKQHKQFYVNLIKHKNQVIHFE